MSESVEAHKMKVVALEVIFPSIYGRAQLDIGAESYGQNTEALSGSNVCYGASTVGYGECWKSL
jgi:hypothetical protein